MYGALLLFLVRSTVFDYAYWKEIGDNERGVLVNCPPSGRVSMTKNKQTEAKHLLPKIILIIVAVAFAGLIGRLYMVTDQQEQELSKLRRKVTRIEARLKSQTSSVGEF